VAQLLKTADVRSVVRREMQARKSTRRAVLLAARKDAVENRRQLFPILRALHVYAAGMAVESAV